MFEREHLSWTHASAPSVAHPRLDVEAMVEQVRPVALANLERLAQGEIAPELVEAMWDAGVLRGQMLRSLGGLEMHPVDWLDLIYELARIDGSIGWLAAVMNGAFDLRPPEVMERLLAGDRRWLPAGSSGAPGIAVRTDGGYRVTGSWGFVTGVPFATFVSAFCLLNEADGSPILDPETGEQLMQSALFPVEDVDVRPEFDALGLRGTGSGGFKADDVFVAEDVVYPIAVVPPEYAGIPLCKELFFAMGHAAHALGLARAAIDAYIELAHRKAGRERGSAFGDAQFDQISIAKADAMVRAGRLLAWDAAASSFDDAHVNTPISYDRRVRFTQANTWATRAAYEAMLLVYAAAGTDGVRTGSKIEQILRDLSTIVQHGSGTEKNHDSVGQYLITRDMPGGPRTDPLTGLITGPPPMPASG